MRKKVRARHTANSNGQSHLAHRPHGALGTITKSTAGAGHSPKPQTTPENLTFKEQAFWLRSQMQKIVKNSTRFMGCGRMIVAGSNHVLLSHKAGGGREINLMQCGEHRLCPMCAIAKATEDLQELKGLVTGWVGRKGGAVCMITFTIRHKREDLLTDSHGVLYKARSSMNSQRAFKALKERYGVVAYDPHTEVLAGLKNGWHPHVHDVWFTAGWLKPSELKALKAELTALWQHEVYKAGGRSIDEEIAVRIDQPKRLYGEAGLIGLAEYVCKGAFSVEATNGALKQGMKAMGIEEQSKGLTPFQLAANVAEGMQNGETMDAFSYRMWKEYEAGYKSLRKLSRTPKIWRALGMSEEEQTEIMAEINRSEDTEDTTETVVVAIDRATFNYSLRDAVGRRLQLKRAMAKATDAKDAQRIAGEMLDAWGIRWTPVMCVLDDADDAEDWLTQSARTSTHMRLSARELLTAV